MNLSLSICHLYPKSMSIYGDKGNIITLMKRCQWRNINVKTTPIEIGQKLNISAFDLFFAGGGQDQSQSNIAKDLYQKKQDIKNAVEQNKVFLLICGSYQLFGKYFKTFDGQKIPGISILDIYTIASKKRKIGNIVTQINPNFNPELINNQFLVGFENHSGNTHILPNSNTIPLAQTISGFGNNDKHFDEGARYKNCFGTYLHGSLLPKNPHFADYLIQLALENKYKHPIALPLLDDSLETQAHNFILEHHRH